MGEEVVKVVTDEIGGQIYRALKTTMKTGIFTNSCMGSHLESL